MKILMLLRVLAGLSRAELATLVEVDKRTIMKLEKGEYNLSIDRLRKVTDYFNLSIDDVVNNNYNAAAFSVSFREHKQNKLLEKIYALRMKCDSTGLLGERFVYELECEKLKHMGYDKIVSNNFADDPNQGFDILSFDLDGKPIYIEVKSTTTDNLDTIPITMAEIKKLTKCLSKGENYEIHRVIKVGTPNCRRIIISGQDFINNYDFVSTNCVAKRKKVS